jgi:hypothetical protein
MKLLVPLLVDPLLGMSREDAADAALKLLLAPEFEGLSGALFMKIRKFQRVRSTARVTDPEEGRRLWELSERLAPMEPISGRMARGSMLARRASAP